MFAKPTDHLGVGINYRSEVAENIALQLNEFDFIEINTERLFYENQEPQIVTIMNSLPIVLHGLSLSIGTDQQEIQPDYFKQLAGVLSTTNFEWFSEHLATTNVGGIEIRGLMPVEFTSEAVERIVKKVKKIMTLSTKPFLLENITYYYPMPENRMSEAEFITEIIEQADCGLLLDLNNVYVNAVNHRYDPYQFIDCLPLDRVVEVHLAGADYHYQMLVDTHASAIRSEVLAMLEYVAKRTKINGVIIERDAKLERFGQLIEEVRMIKAILKKQYCSRNKNENHYVL